MTAGTAWIALTGTLGCERDLPLELETPLWLSRCYGSSAHAAIRRFVEVSHRCCSVLIVRPSRAAMNGYSAFRVAYEVRSSDFATRFEGAHLPRCLGPDSILGAALLTDRRYVRGDELLLPDRDGRKTECGFQTFQNSQSAFALVFPLSETLRRSRTKRKERVVRI